MKNQHLTKKVLVSLATIALFAPISLSGTPSHAQTLQDDFDQATSPAAIKKSRDQGEAMEIQQGLYAMDHPEGSWTSGGGNKNGNSLIDDPQEHHDSIKSYNSFFHTHLNDDSAEFSGYIIGKSQEQKIDELEEEHPGLYQRVDDNNDESEDQQQLDNMQKEAHDAGIDTSCARDDYNPTTYVQKTNIPFTHRVSRAYKKLKKQHHNQLLQVNIDKILSKRLHANQWAIHYVVNTLLDDKGNLVANIVHPDLRPINEID